MTELDLLKKPEYIHVLLNHLPIYGTILARADQMAEIRPALSGPNPGRSNSVFRNRGVYRPTRRSSQASRISAG